MRCFMLLPSAVGLRQVEIDFEKDSVEQEIRGLRRLFGARSHLSTLLDTTLDAEVDKLRSAHLEMTAALREEPAAHRAPAKRQA